MATISTKSISHKVSPPQAAMECGAAISSGQMEKFVSSFQQSTRRWEIIVYPAMFAFVILAGYGFFLIYSLTHDMNSMARSMDPDMGQHMGSMTNSISSLSEQIQVMSGQVQMMTRTMSDISVKLDTLQPMLDHVAQMDHSMSNMTTSLSNIDKMMVQMDRSMTRMDVSIGNIDTSILTMDDSMQNLDQSIRIITATTDQMRRDLTMMNHGMSNLSRPASFANNFMPW
ncbi:DUF948 domain-containing protein [Candidatus Halobeggiatoa sp. HSG11]|nr:DUF948 domain-containing protein [Candidatus Halobeggiatoa sp. HSG11]